MRRVFRHGMVVFAAAALVACGDPTPGDPRGYVKPPLETPGLVVNGEDVSDMVEHGQTVRPRPVMPSEVTGAEEVD